MGIDNQQIVKFLVDIDLHIEEGEEGCYCFTV